MDHFMRYILYIYYNMIDSDKVVVEGLIMLIDITNKIIKDK
jgi:hypothetical protein